MAKGRNPRIKHPLFWALPKLISTLFVKMSSKWRAGDRGNLGNGQKNFFFLSKILRFLETM